MALETKIKTILTADANNFEAGIKRATAALDKASNQWERVAKRGTQGFDLLGTSVAHLGKIFAGISVAQFGRDILRVADELETLSSRTNISATTLSALQFSIQDAGGSLAGFGNSINLMQDKIGELQKGTKTANDEFAKIGLTFADLAGLTTEQQFFKIAKAVSNLGSEFEKTESARNFFGRGAASLIPILNQTNGEIEDFVKNQEALGKAVGAEQVARVDAFGDAMSRMAIQVQNQGIDAIGGLLLYLDKLSRAIDRVLLDVGKLETADISIARSRVGYTPQQVESMGNSFSKDIVSDPNKIAALKQKNAAILSSGATFPQAPKQEDVSGAGAKEAERKQKDLERLYKSNIGYIEGIDAATVKYRDTTAELNELLKEGAISQTEYGVALLRLGTEFESTRATANEWGIDLEAISKRAAENMQDAFADFLFDPFKDGLDGMLKGFVDTMRKMLAEQTSKQLFGSLFGSIGGGAGLLDGLNYFAGTGSVESQVSGLVGFSGLFADGGKIPAGKWGIVGEAGPEPVFGGTTGKTVLPNSALDTSGGNHYVFNIGGDVSQRQFQELQAMVVATVGTGAIEKRVLNAQKRGALA